MPRGATRASGFSFVEDAGLAVPVLSACVETSQTGLPAGGQAKYARAGLVADMGDQVMSSYWQAPLNTFGQDCNPGRDFFALGGGLFAVIAVAGASGTKDANFQPRFVLWISNPEADKAWMGENACTVGLQATQVDPATDEGVTQGVQVTGRTIIPGKLTARDWDHLPKAEKVEVLGVCRSAINSAVSQSLRKLDVVK